MKHHAPVSARAAAIKLLNAVLSERRTLDDALALHPPQGAAADVGFAMMLVLTVLRHLGQLDVVIGKYLEKPLAARHSAVQQALRVGAAQLLLLDTPPHAAVHETVEAVKQLDGNMSGLANAVLQNIAREKPELTKPTANLPDALRVRWVQHYGHDAVKAIAAVAAERPPLDINLPAPNAMAEGARLDTHVWRLGAEHGAVTELEGFAEGAFFVQDVAAGYPVRALGDVKGLDVLDLGAAPGGKTMQLARAGAQVTALDKSASRMERVRENLARMKLGAELVTGDILEWQPAQHYDAVLLDAPCSATGTWRRHPEVLQVTTVQDITELAAQQRLMLARAWGWVKPGGRLMYCVCSLEHEEGEAQAVWFMQHHPDAVVRFIHDPEIPAACISNGMLRTLPHQREGGMDGFFAVVFQKN